MAARPVENTVRVFSAHVIEFIHFLKLVCRVYHNLNAIFSNILCCDRNVEGYGSFERVGEYVFDEGAGWLCGAVMGELYLD